MTSNANDIRRQARELLVKAKTYGVLAWVFALAGFAVFVALYIRHLDGRLLEALADPATILIVLVPFLPAIVLSFKASKAQRSLRDMHHKEDKNSGDKRES